MQKLYAHLVPGLDGRLLAGASIRGGLQYILLRRAKGGPGHKEMKLGIDNFPAFAPPRPGHFKDAIKDGTIFVVAGFVSCTTLRDTGGTCAHREDGQGAHQPGCSGSQWAAAKQFHRWG